MPDHTVSTMAPGAPSPRRDSAAPVDVGALANATIYFGHQSVGSNIIEGVRELAGDQESPLAIIRTREPDEARGPALVEFLVGENGRPESKLADFANTLDQLGGTRDAIAILKYCYLDIGAETDVKALFARHREAVAAMRNKHPGLTFVHVTAPLTTVEPAPKYLLKRVLGKPTAREANARRNEFNAMLRAEYAGEPVFDLALIESTRADGSRAFVDVGGQRVYALAPELTDDGGHLNARGRRAAAEELLAVLGRVVESRAGLARRPSS